MEIQLTQRQRQILVGVVEEHVATGDPVGSKTLVERTTVEVSSSTVRNEFAALEALGLLTHPHTSAGRVPTERGYRVYARELLGQREARPGLFPLDLSELRSEVEGALQQTTEMLSEVTRLLALVSAPALETARVHHVEVLLLQPTVVLVVVITSAGGVTKRVITFAAPVDPGLVDWAREYLNEGLAGVQLGTHTLRRRLGDPGSRARARLRRGRPAGVHGSRRRAGAAALRRRGCESPRRGARRRARGLPAPARDTRAASLAPAADRRGDGAEAGVRPRGDDLDHPGLRDVALVGSTYGLANRTLGAVSLLGPLRMDYDKALRSVRGAAQELSRFVERVYDET